MALKPTISLGEAEYQALLQCIHCGFCLTDCPTYRVLGVEADSPRGRLYLMRAASEGRIALTRDFAQHINQCLVCRNCEAVCPSKVPYSFIVSRVKGELEARQRRPLGQRLARWATLELVIPRPRLLHLVSTLLRLYQRWGVRSFLKGVGLLRGRLAAWDSMLPSVPSHFIDVGRDQVFPAQGERRFRVGLLAGCVASTLYAEVDRATIRVLTRNGCEVVIPGGQTCCGAVHAHNGHLELARRLARKNLDVFLRHELDAIIVNAGGCGATMKEYPELFPSDSEEAERARELSQKVRDINEFLASIPLNNKMGPLEVTVTFQDPCHLAHAQGVKAEPRRLLEAIPGLRLVEMKDSAQCCGGAGTYVFENFELSMKVLDAKMDAIEATGAEWVVVSNPPCYMQLTLGVARRGLKVRVKHIVEVLDEAYRRAERGR